MSTEDTGPALYAIGALASLSPVQKALPEAARAALAKLQAGSPEEVQASQAKPTEADRQAMGMAHELVPPWDLEGLARLSRSSSALRPCIGAYAVMGPGFGWQLKPVIDVASPGAEDRVKAAMIGDRLLRSAGPGGVPFEEPTPEDVAAFTLAIEREMAIEEPRLKRFLDHCAIDRGLTQLRKERTHEQESTGNAYWEVLRRRNGPNGSLDGTPAYYRPVPSTTVRLRRIDDEPTMWKWRERVSLLRFEEVEIPWRFRSFVQRVHGMDTTYFREHGDLRPRGARTGRVYATMAELEASGEPLATELVHWRIFDPDTPYGVPRWISSEFSVGGIQEAERLNYYYFDGRAIPPGILAVSGGKLKEGAAQTIEKVLTERAAGRAAFYSMLVLEATATGDASAARCRIEWIPLTDGSEKDGRFLEYQRQEGIKVQTQFRLPDLLTGRSQEANKAQAEAALRFTEQQVFQPLREDEDEWWNRRVLPDLGIKWWTFRTNSAVASDPAQQMDLIVKAAKDARGLVGAEVRELIGEVFNRKFPPIDEPWTKLPFELALQGIQPIEGAPSETAEATPVSAGQAGNILQRAAQVATQLRGLAAADFGEEMEKARREAAEPIVLSEEDWKQLVERQG